MSGDQSSITKAAVNEWLHSESEVVKEDVQEYHHFNHLKYVFIVVCIVIAFITAGYALSIGEYDISFLQTYQLVWDHITGNVPEDMAIEDYVVCIHRAPRVVGGILAGMALSIGGVMMQGILKNPLADTYTTGISSGASLGATLAICAGFTVVAGQYSLVINAFIFSLIPMFVIISVSKLKSASVTTIIMAGIAVMYLFNAVTSLMKIWAENAALAAVFEWSVGDLTGLKWEEVVVMAIVVIPGTIILYLMAEKLNAMTMGDEQAKTLGINVEKFRIASLLVTSLVTAAVVCFTGLIGFIGLVCPHIVRMFIGSDNRLLLPASAAFGAAFLIVCDVLGRVILAPTTLQVGIITAFIGGPMFLYLIIKQRRTGW
ncbi:iron ABC transporter permease protein [methanogenic archaeon mixed culture ISO4-G1]|nr:iron ABC transporter permease protein [methanogenic archaeon mixed culture ISO4-G1]